MSGARGARRSTTVRDPATRTGCSPTWSPSPGSYIRTVTAIHLDPHMPDLQHVTVNFLSRGLVAIAWAYLTHDFADGRTGGLALAYPVTADRAQGSTMATARAVVTDTTSRPGFYVMVSRGQTDLAANLTTQTDLTVAAEDGQWLPVLRHPRGLLQAVAERLERSRPQRLATDLDPNASAAHTLRHGRTLAELATMRHQSEAACWG